MIAGSSDILSVHNNDNSSDSGIKNLLESFNYAEDEPIEHMPDYEQYVSGNLI